MKIKIKDEVPENMVARYLTKGKEYDCIRYEPTGFCTILDDQGEEIFIVFGWGTESAHLGGYSDGWELVK